MLWLLVGKRRGRVGSDGNEDEDGEDEDAEEEGCGFHWGNCNMDLLTQSFLHRYLDRKLLQQKIPHVVRGFV